MNWGFKSALVIIAFVVLIPDFAKADNKSGFIPQCFSRSADQWRGKDKILHFAVSAGIAFSGFYIYREELHNDTEGSYYFSGGVTLTIGGLKEYYDWKHPKKQTASWKDFAADFLGTCAGLTLAYIAFD